MANREFLYVEATMPYGVHVLASGAAFRPEALTAAGAVSVDNRTTTLSITGGSNVPFTLPDGVEGQEKVIALIGKGGAGSAVLTPAHFWDGTTITFAAATPTWVQLLFLNGKWTVKSKSAANVTVA